MIDPSPGAQASFEGDSRKNLAELPLLARSPGGLTIPFRVILGFPFQRKDFPNDCAIRVELDGLETTGRPIMGVNEFQAMILAIRFMLSRLDDITQKRNLSLFYAGDPDEPFDRNEFFSTIPN